MKSRLGLAFVILLILVGNGSGSPLRGQSASTGALTGTVIDPSGAVTPGATVTLINNATSQTQTTSTGSNGTYRFSLLPPDTYSVKFSAQGFKTVEVPSVTVNVTETPVLDAKLEVGETSQQVTVTGEAEAIVTQSAANGTLVDSHSITAIPLSTRNFTQVISLSTGAVSSVNNAGKLGKGTNEVSVNGMPTGSNNYQMDGSDANQWAVNSAGDSSGQFTGIAIPNADAIAEFKIQTSQFDAGYGRSAGANVNVVTKSGTNDFHGAAFEFLRNDIFNANEFFRRQASQSRPVLKQNQFGATLGGPIRKNKFFFFGSYQGTRQSNGLDQTALSSAFQPPLTNDRSAATVGAEFCPANKPAAQQSKYTTFAGGTQVACDGSNINPVALKILQMKLPDGSYVIPVPQTIQANGLGFSSYSIPSTYREDQFMVNTDYVLSSKHTLSERYFYSRQPQLQTFSTAAVAAVPGSPASFLDKNHNASLKLTSLLTNNLVNELKAGYTRFELSNNTVGLPLAASMGLIPPSPLQGAPPAMVITGGLEGNFQIFGDDTNDFRQHSTTYSIADQVSWVHGRQAIRAGGTFQPQQYSLNGIGRARGKLSFQTFGDFLLGMSAAQNGSPIGDSNVFMTTSVLGPGPGGGYQFSSVSNTGSLFFQDDLKLNSRLTLNLGLRWEYFSAAHDTSGRTANVNLAEAMEVPIPPASGTFAGVQVASTYDPSFVNPYTGKPLGLPAGVFVNSNSSPFVNGTPLNGFAPRIGFAWQPGKTQSRFVVRGGYGLYNDALSGNSTLANTYRVQPFDDNIALSAQSNGTATLQVPAVGQIGFVPRTVSTLFTDAGDSSAYNYQRVQQWSLNTQTSLPQNMVLEIGYVGSRGRNLPLAIGRNQPRLASPGSPVNCGLPNTAAGLGVSATTFAALGVDANGCVTTNTTGNARYRVPLVGYAPTALGGAPIANLYEGTSWFDSLQVTLRKQMTRGWTMQAAYTYSKSLATNSVGDQTLPVIDYESLSSTNRAQRLIISYIYQVPTPFRDRALASGFLGGWSVSGVTTVQSGSPMTLTDPRAGTVYGNAGTGTVTLCPGLPPSDLKNNSGGNDLARYQNWFNKASVCNPPVIGTGTGYGNTSAFIIAGPGQFNWDITLRKMTRVGGLREDAQLEFRTEFYNAFNHTQFNNPGTTFGSATFGVITSTSVAPRLIQFGLKYLF